MNTSRVVARLATLRLNVISQAPLYGYVLRYSRVVTPKTTQDGSRTLYSERYRETFHSSKGALSEAHHVFLAASGVATRLSTQGYARVLEVGFGTGLNFFLSADLALSEGARLDFSSLEQTLLSAETVRSLGFEAHLAQPELLGAYLAFRKGLAPTVSPGRYKFTFGKVGLELLIGEATAQALPEARYDTVYQDAFSPDTNPELWSEAFLEKLLRGLKPGGVLTTYSVKGAVRRRLQDLSQRGLELELEKRPGPPGGKREMLWLCRR